MKQEISEEQRKSGILTGAAIAFLLLALPLAVWLDLTELSKTALRRQAIDLNSVITSVRSYYATNVVGRIIANPNGTTRVIHNYESIPGAIPIPATLSLELGRVIGAQQENITYRFVSDFPFQNRAPHQLDKFREGRARIASQRSRAEDRRHRDLAVQRQGPADCSGDDGPGLRQLPQQPPREPEEGLEGW
ncbi:hypothetical protein ACVWXL_006556 [Bradyrhizobium sp. GM22.5]